uniref:Uncharacterized protein n=1 Tax=Ditylenchus dipsaci TaxID=166011 RepID=A0A915EIZ2_9BILA
MPPTTNTQQILKIFPGLAAPLHHQNAEVNPPNFVNPLPTQSAVGPSEINFQGNPNFPYSQDQTPNTAVHQQETEYSNSVNFVPSAKVDLSSAKNQIIDLKTENANYSNKEHNIEDELPSVPTHKVTNKRMMQQILMDHLLLDGKSQRRWFRSNTSG